MGVECNHHSTRRSSPNQEPSPTYRPSTTRTRGFEPASTSGLRQPRISLSLRRFLVDDLQMAACGGVESASPAGFVVFVASSTLGDVESFVDVRPARTNGATTESTRPLITNEAASSHTCRTCDDVGWARPGPYPPERATRLRRGRLPTIRGCCESSATRHSSARIQASTAGRRRCGRTPSPR